jgi:hypothetical protein
VGKKTLLRARIRSSYDLRMTGIYSVQLGNRELYVTVGETSATFDQLEHQPYEAVGLKALADKTVSSLSDLASDVGAIAQSIGEVIAPLVTSAQTVEIAFGISIGGKAGFGLVAETEGTFAVTLKWDTDRSIDRNLDQE